MQRTHLSEHYLFDNRSNLSSNQHASCHVTFMLHPQKCIRFSLLFEFQGGYPDTNSMQVTITQYIFKSDKILKTNQKIHLILVNSLATHKNVLESVLDLNFRLVIQSKVQLWPVIKKMRLNFFFISFSKIIDSHQRFVHFLEVKNDWISLKKPFGTN